MLNPKKPKSRNLLGTTFAVLVVLCAVIVALVAIDSWAGAGKVHRGVQAGGVDLGGMTPEQAQNAFEERAQNAPREVRLDGPGGQDLTLTKMGASFDAGVTVEKAYAVGREGNIAERVSERWSAVFGEMDVPPEVVYQSERVNAGVERISAQVNETPQNAAASLSGAEVQVFESSRGYELDEAATINNVERALEDRSGDAKVAGKVLEPEIYTQEAEQAARKARNALSGPITLQADNRDVTISPEGLATVINFTSENGDVQVDLEEDSLREGLDRILSDVEAEPQNADYDVNGDSLTLVPARIGHEVDKDKLVSEMAGGIFQGDREYQLSMTTTQPRIKTDEARGLKPTTLLSEYRTNYDVVDDPGGTRAENMRIASGAVSQQVVAPGETFSMNDTVDSLDYNSTKVIVGGSETTADGGGLCQVTSTLYNAANFAGLDIVERHPHTSQLPYIRPGMDATVWFGFGGTGELDMKFRNNTDAYLLLQERVSSDGYIYAEIYGQPTGREVSMSSEPVIMGNQGSEWATYKTITDNGKVIFDGKMYNTEYGPLATSHGIIPPPKVLAPPVNP